MNSPKLTWQTIRNESTGEDEHYTGKEFEACIIKGEFAWELSYTDWWSVPDLLLPQLKGTYLTRIKHPDLAYLKHYAQHAFDQYNKYCLEKGLTESHEIDPEELYRKTETARKIIAQIDEQLKSEEGVKNMERNTDYT